MATVLVFSAVLLVVVGVVAAFAAAWVRADVARTEAAAAARHAETEAAAAARVAELQAQLTGVLAESRTEDQLLDAASAMTSRSMAEQSNQFVHIAESKFQSLTERSDSLLEMHNRQLTDGLEQMHARIRELERQRSEESRSLQQMVRDLRDVTVTTKEETARLVGALRDNRVRGLWGETQLRRVIQMSGMEAFCDFAEQRGYTSGERSGRPDVIVRLPNDRAVVIDAKVPLDRYLEAANCTDDPTRLAALIAEHAKMVSGHVLALSRRDYTEMVDGAVDVVVMFLPGDSFLSAALDGDPTLFESAWSKGVVLASPGSLFALLKTLTVGWQERRVAEEAARIAELGRELHERIATFAEHFSKVGTSLGRSVDAYNKAVGSMESRLLSTARKLEEHAAGSRRALPISDELLIESVPRPPVVELSAVADAEPIQLAPPLDRPA